LLGLLVNKILLFVNNKMNCKPTKTKNKDNYVCNPLTKKWEERLKVTEERKDLQKKQDEYLNQKRETQNELFNLEHAN